MRVEDVPRSELLALVERLECIRHDLGKYVRFETRFAGDDADVEVLRTALRADLLATRRTGESALAAWDLWARLRPAALDDDPDVVQIDADIEALERLDLEGSDTELRKAVRRTAAIAQASKRLVARARTALDGAALVASAGR